MIPHPGFGVDGFANRPEHAQRRLVVLGHLLRPVAHERADGRRRGVENVDLVALHHVPVPAVVGVHGRRLEHDSRRAVEQGAVHDVAVPGDPADIGGTPEQIVGDILALLRSEQQVVGQRRPQQIPAGGVQHALGLAGRSRGVEDEQRVFRLHRFAGAIGCDVGRKFVVPVVAAGGHRHLAPGMAQHQHSLDRNLVERGIDIGFERNGLARPKALICRDDHTTTRVIDAVFQRFRRVRQRLYCFLLYGCRY